MALKTNFGEFTLERWENWYATRAGHDDRLDLSIIERSSGEWAGEVVLNKLDVPNESCAFRIALQGPRFYGRGLGSEATRLVTGYAFNVVGVHRVELEVYDFNSRARHMYEEAGFDGRRSGPRPWLRLGHPRPPRKAHVWRFRGNASCKFSQAVSRRSACRRRGRLVAF